jgi:ornithine cyclodeaminase
VLGREDVRQLLDWKTCIEVVREAMMSLSDQATRQLPRHILPLGAGKAFGVMAGALPEGKGFGAKLISVFPENHARELPSHQGIVVLHDEAKGAPVCIADAAEITRFRTAAASAAATDALARADAASLTILGYGEQARAHAHAIAQVRNITGITIWGRDQDKATCLAAMLASELDISARSEASVGAAVADADIVCTTTAATDPILKGTHVKPGTHVNLVGSSRAGPAEADAALVALSRFFVDSRENVLAEGTEFRAAMESGLVDEKHIVAEVGEVFAGSKLGRTSSLEITTYKSLGHVVQDIAAARYLFEQAHASGRGVAVPF